ncbi:hypothetical protein BKK49_09515 [Rodentibacter rarus]|uniref:non-specific serine/threonine protein kinase n=1 Tax=Rodentibacter rarus TaxID=1908260 RepID=A0A1V3IQH9_9PAST|nr:RIO1 family regulatory kinase/ATPase [Rodentibacter rarus]OOF38610.1 hypothetical protein BKK49_09515 [Rodentibacter rarus]OOF44204.1 hypothetical protein BKK50_03200 [Rodentibacter rarus]
MRILEQQKGKRIFKFNEGGKDYWLKQPEKLSGIWLLLKPHPKTSFTRELETLLSLAKQNAPVPQVICYGNDFFVLEDVGSSISQWVDNLNVSEDKKYLILSDASQALIGLHREGLVHGRPAVRDIVWNDGKVTFLDFESRSNSQNKDWLIVRDMLFFFHSLCRETSISDALVKETAAYYQTHCNPKDWKLMQNYLSHFSWVYYLLLPFKPIAKKDLIAIYRLFELLH